MYSSFRTKHSANKTLIGILGPQNPDTLTVSILHLHSSYNNSGSRGIGLYFHWSPYNLAWRWYRETSYCLRHMTLHNQSVFAPMYMHISHHQNQPPDCWLQYSSGKMMSQNLERISRARQLLLLPGNWTNGINYQWESIIVIDNINMERQTGSGLDGSQIIEIGYMILKGTRGTNRQMLKR